MTIAVFLASLDHGSCVMLRHAEHAHEKGLMMMANANQTSYKYHLSAHADSRGNLSGHCKMLPDSKIWFQLCSWSDLAP